MMGVGLLFRKLNMALQDLLILEQTVEILKKHRDLEETVAGREAFDRALQELVG
ncbi:hypothetical protein [Paenilisteria weihenstephanensis]|uniref:hypothetical protein n=1 Tax=Listeria weihenstephanensis TaxID=1006155 RepID=UPI0004B3E6AF|nr:hypothetical protein [Listeria weihenstephanensis]